MIYIIVENWSREAYYKFDIARYISSRTNNLVIVLPKNFLNRIISLISGVLLHKSLQSHFYSSVFTFNKNGGKYCVIDEEVLVRDISLENRYGLDKNLCDCAFATSQQDFISYYNNGFKNIILSGNPRFYHKGSGFKSKSKVLRILFSSNFALMRPLSGHSLERVILDQASRLKKQIP